MSMTLNLEQHFIGWYAGPESDHQTVLTEGLQAIDEAIWYAMHPLIAVAFQKPDHNFHLYRLTLNLSDLSKDTVIHRLQEGRSCLPVPPDCITPCMSGEEARALLKIAESRKAGKDAGRRCHFLPHLKEMSFS